MATKKEIKDLLKSMNLTENDMDNFWNDLALTNSTVKAVNRCGKTWRNMNAIVIATIPIQKQKDIDNANAKKIEEDKKLAKELEEQDKEKYYKDHFEEIMIKKIESKENLTEEELKTLVWEYEDESERDEGDCNRWTQSMTSYIKLLDRYFSLNWERGLTEYQENGFYDQPHEVIKHEYEKTMMVTEWIRK